MKVKAITQRDPEFLKTTYKYDNLVDLQNDERFIKIGEKFLRYKDGLWMVYKMNKERIPRLCGKFKTLHTAVYRARLSV